MLWKRFMWFQVLFRVPFISRRFKMRKLRVLGQKAEKASVDERYMEGLLWWNLMIKWVKYVLNRPIHHFTFAQGTMPFCNVGQHRGITKSGNKSRQKSLGNKVMLWVSQLLAALIVALFNPLHLLIEKCWATQIHNKIRQQIQPENLRQQSYGFLTFLPPS